jgi:hypothetical protein
MGILITPLINGKSYEWSDIQVVILGAPITGITNIEYEEKQAMENIYGAGENVVSRGYGKVEPTAKITLKMEEVEGIMSVAPLGRLNKIPEFDIVVLFLDDSLIPRKHVIKNVRFTGNNRKSSTGDTSLDIDLELICSHILWLL